MVDVLEAFGWTGSRQKPITERETDPNVLQPGVLANGTLTMTLTRAAHGSELADWRSTRSRRTIGGHVVSARLSRRPKPDEREAFVAALAEGFDSRLVPADEITPPEELPPLPQVTWFNHLRPKANTIQQEMERRVRAGRRPTRAYVPLARSV